MLIRSSVSGRIGAIWEHPPRCGTAARRLPATGPSTRLMLLGALLAQAFTGEGREVLLSGSLRRASHGS